MATNQPSLNHVEVPALIRSRIMNETTNKVQILRHFMVKSFQIESNKTIIPSSMITGAIMDAIRKKMQAFAKSDWSSFFIRTLKIIHRS